MGAYGSPELPPNPGEIKYEDQHQGEEYDVIKCPKCGEPIKIRRQALKKRVSVTPSLILKYTAVLCLCVILIAFTLSIVKIVFASF